MEEVDKILIHALRQVGTEVPEDVDSVRLFSSELVVEAVVSCLRVIDPGLGHGLPTSLPPGMSARFRVGLSLAQACQDIGFKGEIGYQTFLYSSELEIRSLLMFLVEKLPRGSAESSDQSTGQSVLLHKGIAATIKAQLQLSWLPPNCRLSLDSQPQGPDEHFHMQPLSVAHSPDAEELSEVRAYRRELLPPVTAQSLSRTCAAASLLERHAAERSAAQERQHEWNNQGLLSRLTQQEYHLRKRARLHKCIDEQLRSAAQCSSERASHYSSDLSEFLQAFKGCSPSEDVLTKGTHFTHTQRFTFTQAADSGPSPQSVLTEGSPQLLQRDELASLQQQFEELCSDVEQLSVQLKHFSFTNAQVLNDIKKRERENEDQQEQIEVKKKTIHMLPHADNNLHNIQELVETSAKRVLHLATQWEKHRAPLIEQNRKLKEICKIHDMKSSGKLSEIRSLHEKISVCSEEARKKEETYKQLVSELESLPQDVSRSAYTQRILEIVSNIRKQKEEIIKILLDTKELQKEINNLTGKLDRTFAVTDELIFKDAKKDESVRKSYKHLAALHEVWTLICTTSERGITVGCEDTF